MPSNGFTRQKLDDLFPAPSRLPPSHLSPQRLPGPNLESLAALQDVLKDNHQRYHVFCNKIRYHNHVAHRAIAIYTLGGPGAIIRDYYERDGHLQCPAIESPEPITEENFIDHLEDEKFYQSYVSFFVDQISKKGVTSTLEGFIFSEKYNLLEGRGPNAQPEMLARFFSGVIHPLIHVGYGAEFGLEGIIAEGLAMTAVEEVRAIVPTSLFFPVLANSVGCIEGRLPSYKPAAADAPITSQTGNVHAFDIAARILKDDRLDNRAPVGLANQTIETLLEFYPVIKEHAEQWTIDLNQPGDIERKLEEVIWLSTLIYGTGGFTPKGPNCDMFFVHLVSPSLFLSSVIAYLSPRSQALLLRGFFFTVLTWWAMRGRPALNIESFMTTTSVEPSVLTTPAPNTPSTTETTPTPNPFLLVLQSAIAHPLLHVAETQRAFAHFNTLYGMRPAGYFKNTELGDAKLLDGSLFLRAALLTADHVGWVREGGKPRQFNLKGPGISP